MRHLYADFIDRVAKPARYLGGEYQAVVKDDAADARVCLAFPDVYDIGMSHLGTKILYSLLNERSAHRVRARVRAVDRHGGRAARARRCRSSRSRAQRPLREFDVVGFSLQYELTFTNVLTMLDLGGIPLRAADRARGRAARARRRPDGDAPRAAGAVHRRRVHRRGRGAAAAARARVGGAAQARSRAGTRTRADALAELASTFPLYVPSLYATEVDADDRHDRRRRAARSARAGARSRARWSRDLDAYPFPTRHAGAVRRGRVRSRVGRDRARLHRGLPVLPGRHDLPPGARALAGSRSPSR